MGRHRSAIALGLFLLTAWWGFASALPPASPLAGSGDGGPLPLAPAPAPAAAVAPGAPVRADCVQANLTHTRICTLDADFLDGLDSTAFAAAGHAHDARYFTQDALRAPGTVNDPGNPVHWTKLKGVPAGFEDGTDDGEVYQAGDGLRLDGTTFSLEPAIRATSLTTTGSAGIGTANPASILDVRRDQPADTRIDFRNTDPAGRSLLRMHGDAAGGGLILTGSANSEVLFRGRTQLWNDAAGVSLRADAPGGDIQFLTGGFTAAHERVRITSAGAVGIGTATPGGRLEVSAPGATLGLALFRDQGTNSGFKFDVNDAADALGYGAPYRHAVRTGTGESLLFRVGAGHDVVLDVDGNVGIGREPDDRLDVAGDVRVGTGATGCVKDRDGTVIAGTCSSDARLKTGIEPFGPVLDRVARLQPVHFAWAPDAPAGYAFGPGLSYGLIAQDAEALFPDLVAEDDRGFKAVRYGKVPMYTLQAVRELAEQAVAREHRLAGLEARLAERDQRVAALEAELASQAERLERIAARLGDPGPAVQG